MTFKVSSTALADKLQVLAKVTPTTDTMPILKDFLFELSGTRLGLTASDGENRLYSTMDIIESDSDVRFTINSSDILLMIKGIADQPLTFVVDDAKTNVDIYYQNGEGHLPITAGDEYPDLRPTEGDVTTITLPVDIVWANLARTISAAAQDELRPVMNGVYFDLTADCLTIVASDGKKLVRSRILAQKSDNPTAFILPKKPATLLKGILEKEAGDITLNYTPRSAEIIFESGKLDCRLIEGRYPNYNSVIPTSNNYRLVVDHQALLNSVRRVLPFTSREANHTIRLTIEQTNVRVDYISNDARNYVKENISCEYEGVPMSIGFRDDALMDVLTNITGEQIEILLGGPDRPCLMQPTIQEDGQELLILIMPTLLADEN